MFKVKRRLTKSLRNGEQASRNYSDGGSDNSSGAGAASSAGSISTNPRKKSCSKTNDPLHHCDIDFNGNSRACESTLDSSDDSGHQIPNKNVRFSIIQVREFERILGDNPSCSSGAPIGIGWAYGNEKKLCLDKYEESKMGLRKKQLGLVLTRQAREELLLDWGVSFHDIIDSIRTNVKVKNQRRRTVNAIGTYDRWEEVMENASRKIKRTLFLKKSKKDDFVPYHPTKAIQKNSDEYKDHDSTLSSQRHELPNAVPQMDYSSSSDRNSKSSIERDDKHAVTEIRTLPSRPPSSRSCSSRHRDELNTSKVQQTSDYDDDPNNPIHYVNTGFGTLPCVEITPNFHVQEQYRSTQHAMSDRDRDQYPEKPVSTLNYLKRVMESPRFLDAMDDPELYYEVDDMTAQTPMSEFTHTEFTYEDDDDIERENDGCDEFEALDRDCSHWEVRSSGQNCPVITRKMTPVIISEDGFFEFGENRWQENFAMQPPPNSAHMISNWE